MSALATGTRPAASAKPTATARPTPSAKPTATARPAPSARPTATARPAASAKPTATAQPANAARPTATARLTPSAWPTATALFCLGVPLAQAQASQSPPATIPDPTLAVVIQPRPSGYFVGDLVTQRVLLEGAGQPDTRATRPALGLQPDTHAIRPAPDLQADTSATRPAPDLQADTSAIRPAPDLQSDTAATRPAPGPQSDTPATRPAPAGTTDTSSGSPAPTHQPYTPVALPPPGRVNAWLERRHTTIDTDASGHRWLVIEYQFLNAPKAVTAVTLPGWQLTVKASAATPPVTLKVPAASLNVAPLSPPGSPQQVGTRDLRPDRIPPNIATAPILHAIAISTGGLAVTLVAWLAWVLWRNKRAAATQPFAHALRELRTFTGDQLRAWQILHRAFDRAAGRVIHSATLPALFERAPQLVPARSQIEEFFAQSNQLFFAHANAASTSAAILNPLTLCLELRRIEKRHER